MEGKKEVVRGKCSKFQTPKKRKNILNLFSLLTSEAKISDKFCKELPPFAKLVTSLTEFLVFFGIFLFEIKILLYKFLGH